MTYVKPLTDVLAQHLSWHWARLKFITRFTAAILTCTSTNLRRVALALTASMKPASNYRWIRRFLSE